MMLVAAMMPMMTMMAVTMSVFMFMMSMRLIGMGVFTLKVSLWFWLLCCLLFRFLLGFNLETY